MKTIYDLEDPCGIASPALLYSIDGVRENARKVIEIAGDAKRLWPHVKTHKTVEVVRIQQSLGITRFKCATIAEAEMLGMCRADEILLAYPLIGPAVPRFLSLMQKFPDCGWWAIGDDDSALSQLEEQALGAGLRPNVLIDVDMGQHRTGVPLSGLEAFYRKQQARKGLFVRGLHCYDGHMHNPDIASRKKEALSAAQTALAIRDRLNAEGVGCDTVVIGGSPTLPCHAIHEDVYLSPGTILINDHGYTKAYPDLVLEPAAAILTRVISLPGEGLFTVDLGYKAIGADPKGVRGVIASLPEAEPVNQSEEHWIFRLDSDSRDFPHIGQELYVIPTHICSTTALYAEILAIHGGRVAEVWPVTARNRRITV